MTICPRFILGENNDIIDTINPANTGKAYTVDGEPNDERHLREIVLAGNPDPELLRARFGKASKARAVSLVGQAAEYVTAKTRVNGTRRGHCASMRLLDCRVARTANR
jgi:hypothetical protein